MGNLTVAERFWRRVDRSDPDQCWPWTGRRSAKGYGTWHWGGRTTNAHRVAYVLTHGAADGLVVDHLCRNRACCNPAHLEAVTNRENLLRGVGLSAVAAKKTSCDYGHPLDGKQGRGDRYCRTCRAEYNRRHYAANAERYRQYARDRRAVGDRA